MVLVDKLYRSGWYCSNQQATLRRGKRQKHERLLQPDATVVVFQVNYLLLCEKLLKRIAICEYSNCVVLASKCM